MHWRDKLIENIAENLNVDINKVSKVLKDADNEELRYLEIFFLGRALSDDIFGKKSYCDTEEDVEGIEDLEDIIENIKDKN